MFTIAQGGGGGGGQWLQLVGFILVVGLSALSWIIQKLQEQSAKKKRIDAAQRRELEMLRTGRDPNAEHPGDQPIVRTDASAPPVSPTSRQDQLAARRQAQLEELRRRARQRASSAPAPASPQARPQTAPSSPARPQPARRRETPIVLIPGSSGPIVAGPRAGQKPPAAPKAPKRPAPQRQTVNRPFPAQINTPRQNQRDSRQPRQAPSTQVRAVQDQPPARESEQHEVTHRLLVDSVVQGEIGAKQADTGPAVALGAGAPRTAAEWRQALIAREILSAPVGIRPPGMDVLQ